MRCFLGLGGNVGDVPETFRRAAARLRSSSGVAAVRLSRLYRTRAVGERAGEPFLNAAGLLETTLAPLPLLDLLQTVEAELGRRRDIRWGPRTLDLDLLFYGDAVIDEPRLRIPHPGCWHRRFVLDPLAELAAGVVHPEKGLPIESLRARLLARPLRIGLAGSDRTERQAIVSMLGPRSPEVIWEDSDGTGSAADAALILWLGPPVAFESLPAVPRLDLTRFPEDRATAAGYVLDGALGVPEAGGLVE